MRYDDRIVCFIDILGFASLIDGTHDNGVDREDEIDRIARVLNHIRVALDIDDDQVSASKVVTQFSDSIVISFDYTEPSEIFYTLLDISYVLIGLIEVGVLCRGGVSVGKVIHTTNMLFGPAMNDAYVLESKAANYPRIILSGEIIRLSREYRSSIHQPDVEESYVKSLLGRDSDGMFYIDYVESQDSFDDPEIHYPSHLMRIAEILSVGLQSTKPDIYVKYSWLKEKYMAAVMPLKESLPDSGSCNEIQSAIFELPEFH